MCVKDSYKKNYLAILKGSLAGEGAVTRITGLKNPVIAGPACVFEDRQSVMSAILDDQIKANNVLVLRYLGPKGGLGTPEILAPTSAIIGRNLGESVGFITGRRFSDGTQGMMVGHVVSEAYMGGTIGSVREEDSIITDTHQRLL